MNDTQAQAVINKGYADLLNKVLPAAEIIVDATQYRDPWLSAIRTFKPSSHLLQYDIGLHGASGLAGFCSGQGLWHLDLLRISSRTGAQVLESAQELLEPGYIDFILVEVEEPYNAAFFSHASKILETTKYAAFEVTDGGYIKMDGDPPALATASNYLFAAERVVSWFQGLPPKMFDLERLFETYAISARGVVHVGAHEGQEAAVYKRLKSQAVLFVEANPTTYDRLVENIDGVPGFAAVQCAVCDYDGDITLRVTSSDQSSSILELKDHLAVYPNIVETGQVRVPARKLDTLLRELKAPGALFNVMNLDIQGAELCALRGAPELLSHIDAIYTEINFRPLYEGAAQCNELEAFLDEHGFERVETICPYHPSWGDALFVRKRAVCMSTLGENGRFGNQLFQYAFLRFYARQHGLRVETPKWIGQELFGHDDPAPRQAYPVVTEMAGKPEGAELMVEGGKYSNVDFWGYFHNTSFYASDKPFFRSLFKPKESIEYKLRPSLERLKSKGKTLVGMHLRRGDYGKGYFFITPDEWNLEVLRFLWKTVDSPVLFIASDDLPATLPVYKEFEPLTSESLGGSLEGADFYPDFYLLSQCNILLLSNSSFSFAAALVGEEVRRVYRPVPSRAGLVETDLWSTYAVLKETL